MNSDAVRLLIPELRGNAMSRIIAAAGEKTSIEALRAAVERFETVGLPRSKLAELSLQAAHRQSSSSSRVAMLWRHCWSSWRHWA